MRIRIWLWAVAVFLCLPSASASAQSAFIGAGGGYAAVRVAHQESASPSISNNDIGGDAGWWGVTGGASVARHAVLQAQFTNTGEVKSVIAPTVLVPPCPACSKTTTTVRYRTRELAVMAGYTSGRERRVTLSALGGLVFVAQTVHYSAVTEPSPLTPIIRSPPVENVSTGYFIGPEFGLDVSIGLSRHVRLVPQARYTEQARPSRM